MFKIILGSVITCAMFGAAAHGQVEGISRVEKTIASKSVLIRIPLNAGTVKCSPQGYSAPFLKVLVPELAELTVLNHRNIGETAPCVAAFPCEDGNEPSLIIKDDQPSDIAQVNILQKRVFIRDHERRTCAVKLEETIRTVIRQVEFSHVREADLGERDFADCQETSK